MRQATYAWMRAYGYFGLLPFIVFSALSLTVPGEDSLWRSIFDHYSAVILAFMAGIYWPLCLKGDALIHARRLAGIAIAVALCAWVMLVLPGTLRALGFAASFGLLYAIDRFVLADYWPAPYLLMRGHLTAVVVTAQLLLVFEPVLLIWYVSPG